MRVGAGLEGRCWGRTGERREVAMALIRRAWTELSERLRLRRSRGDTSEDDEGLPRSPCNSPTVSDGVMRDKTVIKDLPTKSHSTCSDGSLLSMGSYEDEDSFGPQSRHSSKLSLHEKKPTPDSSFEFEPSSAIPLNHSAAHHRVSVKPKRTHGPPRRKRGQQLSIALPATPEVNEDSSIRSLSPEISRKAPGADSGKLGRSKSNAGGSKSRDSVAPSGGEEERQERLSLLDRIFPRRSGRKKKKEAKVEVEEETAVVVPEGQDETDTETITTETTDTPNPATLSHTESSTFRYSTTTTVEVPKPVPAPRHGVSSRQRVLPIDLPETPEGAPRQAECLSPDKTVASTSPLQVELENVFRQRQISLDASPPPVPVESPPLSPRSPKSPRTPRIPEAQILPTVISSSEQTFYVKSSVTTRSSDHKRSEEFKSRIKMPGLSSLQQRALTLNTDDLDTNFKSLTDFAADNKTHKPLAKSHSFKETKISYVVDSNTNDINSNSTAVFLSREISEENKIAINKAASLDSIKHVEDEPVHLSELKFELKKSAPADNISKTLITISGPSHTPTVTITSNKESFSSCTTKSIETGVVDGSRTISIKENQVSVTKIQVEQTSSESAPEFASKKLHKVDVMPAGNVILSIKSPKADPPRAPFTFEAEPESPGKPPVARKFSKEDLEIVEKPESEESDKSSQDSLDEKPVVMRRKSAAGRRRDEEPELMKVFARRSLKLKDGDLEELQESLAPNVETSPVVLRRTFNSNIFIGHRAVSVGVPKDRRRTTDQWMADVKNEEEEVKVAIDSLPPKSDFITEPKNFSQRKAEWEKRAQLAQKKTAY